MDTSKLFPLSSVEFRDFHGLRSLNMTRLGSFYGKKPENYVKTKQCTEWIECHNKYGPEYDEEGFIYIHPQSFFMVEGTGKNKTYWTSHAHVGYDFVRYCSRSWAFMNTIRLMELWVTPEKYDSDLESFIQAPRMVKNVVDKIDINEFFSKLHRKDVPNSE